MLQLVNNKKKITIARFIWIASFVIVLACAATAQQRADQAIIEFDGDVVGDETGRFTVSDNVSFTHEDTFIQSDSLVLDEDGERAQFFGNVQVHTEDEVISGNRFVYHIPEETSIMFNASGSVEPDSLESPLYYR